MWQFSKTSKFLASTFLLTVISLTARPAHAIIDFGIKGGVGITSHSVSGDSTNTYSSGFGYLAGLGVDFGLLPVGVMVDVLYAHRTIQMNSVSGSMNSLYVPAQASFSLGPIFLSGGAFYAIGVGDITSGGSSMTYSAAGLKGTDYGLVLGLGAKVMSFSIEARYNLGLADVSSVSGVSRKTRSFDVLLGYWF